MLSCGVWFSAPNFWMGGGLESPCIGRVYGADGAVRVFAKKSQWRRHSFKTEEIMWQDYGYFRNEHNLLFVCTSIRLSAYPPARPPARSSPWNNFAPTGWIFMLLVYFQKYVEKIKFSLNSDKNNRYFS